MPNWCENLLESSISLKKYINTKNEFDFNLIKPTPLNLTRLYHLNQLFFEQKTTIDMLKKTIQGFNLLYLKDALKEKTKNMVNNGFTTWEDENWGCKWNAVTEFISDDQKSISFSTPWSPPYGVFTELCKLHKNDSFILKYAEPGMAYSGVIEYNGNGQYPLESSYSFDSGEGKKIAMEVLGNEFFDNVNDD